MGFAVFVHRPDSRYDDAPAERYQFPKAYLSRAEPSAGDWILYYEPTTIARPRGYFAIARVARIVPDPRLNDMFIAEIEDGSYLEFPRPVPFGGADGLPVERGLLNDRGRISGRAQAAVRPISAADVERILDAGFRSDSPLLPRSDPPVAPGIVQEPPQPMLTETVRDRVARLSSRIERDRSFRQLVLHAYDERCAISGLKLINGGGRAEVQAAHIRPVARHGPDSVTNGLALSGTVHWMFDRGLISLGDDLRILISRQANDPEGVRALIRPDGFAGTPQRERDRPHPRYLAWHREHCFKQ